MSGKSRILADIIFLVLLSLLCFSCSVGHTQTVTGTMGSITIPMEQWNELKSEFNQLNNELTECQNELSRIKKPSSQLREELAQAQASLSRLKNQLTEQKKDLSQLSAEVSELNQSLTILKDKINKERKVHRRQLWQNKLWCVLIGAGIGIAVK